MVWREDIDPHHEPHKILIHKDVLIDPARENRKIPYKIYYPVAHSLEHLPVIIWSHGLGGSRDGAAFLARYIASHGYVLINIQHAGTDTSLWEGKPGHPWDVIRAAKITREDSLNRFYDVPFLLDQLPEIAKSKEEIGSHINLDVIGMSGHSFGALTSQVITGQLFPDSSDKLSSIKDPRVKAGILYSFNPIDHLSDEDPSAVYGDMSVPLFFMTGTEDSSPINGKDYKYRMPVYDHAGSKEKYLLILNDGDHMVFAGSRGKLEDNPKRHKHEEIIKVCSLAFWDAHLKEDKLAKAWLTDGEAISYLMSEAELEVKSNE